MICRLFLVHAKVETFPAYTVTEADNGRVPPRVGHLLQKVVLKAPVEKQLVSIRPVVRLWIFTVLPHVVAEVE